MPLNTEAAHQTQGKIWRPSRFEFCEGHSHLLGCVEIALLRIRQRSSSKKNGWLKSKSCDVKRSPMDDPKQENRDFLQPSFKVE